MDSDRDVTGSAQEPAAPVEATHPMWQESPEPIAWQPPAPWQTEAGAATPPPAAYPPPPEAAAMPPEGSYQPYQPPYQPRTWSTGPSWSVTPAFVSARRLASIVTALLAISGVVALAESVHYIMGVDLQGRINTARALQPEADSFNGVMQMLALVSLALSVVCGIAMMRWLWRSLNNAWHLDAGEGISSPKMSVVTWFIPFYNFIRPYRIVIDLHDRLLSPLQSRSGRWLIKAWWTLWILGSVFGEFVFTSTRSSGNSPTGLDRMGTMALLGILASFTFADSILAIAVVRQVQRLSDARELARRGFPAPAIDLVAQSQRPRITRLPVLLAVAAIVALVVPLGAVYCSASAPASWAQFQPSDMSFTVSMPGTPLEKAVAPHESNGLMVSGDAFRSGENGTLAFIVSYTVYPSGVLDSIATTQALDNLQAALGQASTIQWSGDRNVNGRQAREIKGTSPTVMFHVLFCLDGDRVYVLEADYTAAEASSPEINRFLDSFTLP
jgi:hypothetical protein